MSGAVIYDVTLALRSDPCLRFTHSIAVECPWTDPEETARSMVSKATDFLKCRPRDLYVKVARGPHWGALWTTPAPTNTPTSRVASSPQTADPEPGMSKNLSGDQP